MNYKHLLFALSILFLLSSCEDDSDCCTVPETRSEYESGLFVLNEGNFGSGNASVSFISKDWSEMQDQIFKKTNAEDLGDTAQSIELHEDLAVIVVNVSNKIEVVNRFSFESIQTITSNLDNPRFAEVFGKKLYVSNWGDGMNPDDDFVAVFDLTDYSFITSIPVAEGPEKLLEAAGKIFVAHKGGFSFNDKVSVIQSGNDQVVAEIEVGDVPNSMVLDGNRLWVLSGGKPAYASTETPGRLSSINITTNSVEDYYDFPDSSMHPSNLGMENDEVFMTIGKRLYKYSLTSKNVEEAFSMDDPAVLYGFKINEGRAYVASPNADFTGDGTLYIYELSTGDLLNQFSVGINPNGVYFN